jgi:hypothetical protein
VKYLFLIVLLGLSGCEDIVIPCQEDRQCADNEGNPGRCIYDGNMGNYCAIRTEVCPSKYRWGEAAPKAIQLKCVDSALIPLDGGIDAAGDGAGG